jgi:hypothetical protein
LLRFKLLHRLDIVWSEERIPYRSPAASLTAVGPDKTGPFNS